MTKEHPRETGGRAQIHLEETDWSNYCEVYDTLLLNFDAYQDLLQQVAAEMTSVMHCADLGAGTGNSSIALLRAHGSMRVSAVELNQTMLQRLTLKTREYDSRIRCVEADIHRMDFAGESEFDGATLVNVLYAVDAPETVLNEVHRILRFGSPVVLSCPHEGTDIHALFESMKRSLLAKGIFETFEPEFQIALRRNLEMRARVTRFSRDALLALIARCGFRLEKVFPAYANAVLVVRAVKI